MNKAEAIEELNKVKSQLSECKSNAHLLVPVQDLLNDPVVVADAVLQARALILHAFILFETDTSKAFEIYQQAKALCPEDSHQDIKLDLLRLHGRYLVSKTQFGKAAQTFEQALELAESSSSPKIVMSILASSSNRVERLTFQSVA